MVDSTSTVKASRRADVRLMRPVWCLSVKGRGNE